MLIKSIVILYIISIMLLCGVFSSFGQEVFIDGGEIKDVCYIVRNFISDDYRVMAIPIFIAMIPVFIYAFITKFKNKVINVAICLFILVWVWCFLIKFRNCLWF
ncbi:DUF2645 family protein [Rahnella sp. PCH160]|uniref:DUF2645 family protein n=1 Tax=Rahnella sp. PCH160 TaxID=3447928 RepID=UPI0039FCDBB4